MPSAGHPVKRIVYKSREEIDCLDRSARLVQRVLDAMQAACKPGVTTRELDDLGGQAIRDAGGESLFRGYVQRGESGFPADTCISVNDEVVHGIPGDRVIAPGDLVSIDVGVRLDGWCGDSSRSVIVEGEGADPDRLAGIRKLVESTRSVLFEGIELTDRLAPDRGLWSEVAKLMEQRGIESGFGAVTQYVGHGIGRDLHELPKVPAYWTGFVGQDFRLESGMVLAIEPMLTWGPAGRAKDWVTPVQVLDDAWTVVTRDGSIACHEERMVAIWEGQAVILGDGKGWVREEIL